MFDIIIVGGGPAGASAGIYAKRAGMKTLIIDSGESVLLEAKSVQNYYGFSNISGKDLIKNGVEQYKSLGGEFVHGQVVSIVQNYENNTFEVKLSNEHYVAKALILCMGGQKRQTVQGLEKFENVSYCAICDGFFYRDRVVAVLGSGEYAIAECQDLEKVAKKVYLCTNGKTLEYSAENVEVINAEIEEYQGSSMLEKIIFRNKREVEVSGIFVALGKMGSLDIAQKLGILTNNNSIIVDKNMMTNVPGVFAGGDAVGGLLQVAKSVSDGAKAGLEAVRYIKFMEIKNE